MQDNGSEIGRRLRQIRHAQRKSLTVIAGRAGISTSYLSRLESGERALDRRSLIVALANALEVAPSEITGAALAAPGQLQEDRTLTPCACHGRRYVFRGLGAANGAARRPGAKLVDVARRADVSTGTVSNALNPPERVTDETRLQVEKAITELGFIRGAAGGETAAHWRRNGFAQWLFQPAATGWYPKKAPHDTRPVPKSGEPWPGVRRGAATRAVALTRAGCRLRRA